MTELILSDVTRMAGGHCIIGLLESGERYKSVRPGPPKGHAWPAEFPYKRGDCLKFELGPGEQVRPHMEDHISTGVLECGARLSEDELLACLRHAETATSIRDLFGCTVTPGKRGAHLHAPKGHRSICGAEAARVRMKCEADDVRASIAFAWGESLLDLPVVDRSWFDFLKEVQKKMDGANRLHRLNRYLEKRMGEPSGFFVRIGLTRPHPPKFGRCQLMVDTLLPMPRKSWVDEYLTALRVS